MEETEATFAILARSYLGRGWSRVSILLIAQTNVMNKAIN
jgi:hypothetical protein